MCFMTYKDIKNAGWVFTSSPFVTYRMFNTDRTNNVAEINVTLFLKTGESERLLQQLPTSFLGSRQAEKSETANSPHNTGHMKGPRLQTEYL